MRIEPYFLPLGVTRARFCRKSKEMLLEAHKIVVCPHFNRRNVPREEVVPGAELLRMIWQEND